MIDAILMFIDSHDGAIKNRDDLVKIMTVAQVSEALRLAREWMAKFRAARK